MPKQEPVAFERLVVIYNPRSSNAAKTTKIISDLKTAYQGKVVEAAIGKTQSENTNILKNTLREDDVLLVCGGDGSAGNIVECLLGSEMPAKLRSTPVLPVGAGRMNDLARMLNGKHADDPIYALKYGRKITVHPIKCVCRPLEPGKKPLVKTAIYSLGFGYSGEGSATINNPEFRARIQALSPMARPVQFVKDGLKLLKETKFFDISLKGKRQSVLDVTAGNGYILYGFWRSPVKLSQSKFFFALLDDRSVLTTAKTMAEIATSRLSSGKTVVSASFTLHEPVTAHVGGEIFTPPAPCEVSLSLHEEPVTMIATNPKA